MGSTSDKENLGESTRTRQPVRNPKRPNEQSVNQTQKLSQNLAGGNPLSDETENESVSSTEKLQDGNIRGTVQGVNPRQNQPPIPNSRLIELEKFLESVHAKVNKSQSAGRSFKLNAKTTDALAAQLAEKILESQTKSG